HDSVNGRIKARKNARLTSITSGGAIPDTFDYDVVLEPENIFIGTLNEDFAIESIPGDIFQLGNNSWKILRVESGKVRVEDAHGQPPNIPFWLGEAPGRTAELSKAVSALREDIEAKLEQPDDTGQTVADWLVAEVGLSPAGARQLADYFCETHRALGVVPSQKKLVLERFFDE